MNLAIVICVIAVNCIIFFLYEKQQRKSPDSLLIESNGIFKHDKVGGITCILCGILLIGLFILIAFKDSEATLSGLLVGFGLGIFFSLVGICFLLFNFKSFFYIDNEHIKGKYHYFGRIDCNINDVIFALGRNRTLMIQLKDGKRHTIMGIENAWPLATAIREQIFHIETAPPDDLLSKLETAQAVHKKKLFYTLGCVALMFVNIFIAVFLTGRKDMYAFTKTDWLLFGIMGVIEVLTVVFMFYFANQCGKQDFPIEQLKHQLKGAHIAADPLPAGIVGRVYTDANNTGRIVVCGYPNDESVYYCVQEFVGNYLLKTVHTSKIYENEEVLAEDADLNILIDITDHFI